MNNETSDGGATVPCISLLDVPPSNGYSATAHLRWVRSAKYGGTVLVQKYTSSYVGEDDVWCPIQHGLPDTSNAAGQGAAKPYPEPAGSASLVAQPPRDVSELYHELLYAVARCFPGESRHETALRYIRETEERVCETGSCKQNSVLGQSGVGT